MIRKTIFILLCCSLLGFAQMGRLHSGTYKSGVREYNSAVDAIKNGDFKTGVELLELAASKRHREAQFRAGLAYFRGEWVERDLEKALEYFEAASITHPDALYMVALFYENGFQGKPDLHKAREKYELLVTRHSYTYAKTALAGMYYSGRGVEQDMVKAAELYEEAAEDGDKSAMYNLGLINEKGMLGKVEIEQALYWYESAAKLGETKSSYKLAALYRDGLVVSPDSEKAISYLKLGVGYGDANSMADLAEIMIEQAGESDAPAEAINLLNHAATVDNPKALLLLAILHSDNKSDLFDPEKAEDFFNKAIETDSLAARFHYGKCLYEGKPFEQDGKRGLDLIKTAAQENYYPAVEYCKNNNISY